MTAQKAMDLASECLSQKSDFKQGILIPEEGPVELQLRNNGIVDELLLKNPEGFDLKNWITFNHSFKNEDTLVLKNDKIEERFCLKFQYSKPKSRGAALPEKGYVKFPVFFATDRNYNRGKEIEETFGTRRGDLHYGLCEVSIPNTHTPGEIEEPSLWKLEFEEDPKEHIMIHSAKLLSKDSFIKRLNSEIADSDKSASFLFIHGYNVSFSEAAKRTAQISYDLLFDGVPVFYSWPSKASLSGYTNDEANISWAQANIKTFLEDYLTKSTADEIYLIAHSMGNRGLTGALLELLKEQPHLKTRIKEVILAAPDIDADVFKRDIAPKMAELTQNPVTLYVSEDDVALKASKLAHGYPRAGDVSDGLVLIEGIETVDASGIDTSFLGHSYFAESHSIISDIFDLIKTGRRAEKRKILKKILETNPDYWKVKTE
ncbi:hypothetical protein GCM10010465_10460 [Actinomadura fibrosa]